MRRASSWAIKLGLGELARATWGQEPKTQELRVEAGVYEAPRHPHPTDVPIPSIGSPIFWAARLPEHPPALGLQWKDHGTQHQMPPGSQCLSVPGPAPQFPPLRMEGGWEEAQPDPQLSGWIPGLCLVNCEGLCTPLEGRGVQLHSFLAITQGGLLPSLPPPPLPFTLGPGTALHAYLRQIS